MTSEEIAKQRCRDMGCGFTVAEESLRPALEKLVRFAVAFSGGNQTHIGHNARKLAEQGAYALRATDILREGYVPTEPENGCSTEEPKTADPRKDESPEFSLRQEYHELYQQAKTVGDHTAAFAALRELERLG